MGANEIVSMEDALDMGINQIGEKMNDPSQLRLGFLRKVMHEALGGAQALPIDEVGEIMNDIGFQSVGEKLGSAFVAAFPEAEENSDNPPAHAR